MAALMPACDVLGADLGVAAVILCAALAALLLAGIALGFGPLRAWLAPTGPGRAPREPVDRPGQWESGLPGAWQLYRQLRAAAPHHR